MRSFEMAFRCWIVVYEKSDGNGLHTLRRVEGPWDLVWPLTESGDVIELRAPDGTIFGVIITSLRDKRVSEQCLTLPTLLDSVLFERFFVGQQEEWEKKKWEFHSPSEQSNHD